MNNILILVAGGALIAGYAVLCCTVCWLVGALWRKAVEFHDHHTWRL